MALIMRKRRDKRSMVWTLRPRILLPCLQAVEFDRARYRHDAGFRWIVAHTRAPQAFWVVEDREELRRAIRGGRLRAASIHRDNPKIHMIDVADADEARDIVESMGVARWLERPWTAMQRAVVAVTHWKLWRGFDDLPSQSLDWWMASAGCTLSRTSVARLRLLVEDDLAIETLWLAGRALNAPMAARAIERFLAIEPADRSRILTKSLVDPHDDPVSALVRVSLSPGRLSADSPRARINALMGATEKYGDRAMLSAVHKATEEMLGALPPAEQPGDDQ